MNTKPAKIPLRENVTYQLKDRNGNIKQLWKEFSFSKSLKAMGFNVPKAFPFGMFVSALTISNLVVDAGMAGVASRVNGSGAEAAFTYIALGEGTTAANASDTALESEITTLGGQRAAATASRVTTDVTNDTAQLVHTFDFTGTFAITESGVFNAASTGTLLARQVFSEINVNDGDSLQVTWKFDID